MVAPWAHRSPTVDVELLLVGMPPDEALFEACRAAALLVVGRRRSVPVVGARLGRTARRCVELAACPVLVTPGSTETAAPARECRH